MTDTGSWLGDAFSGVGDALSNAYSSVFGGSTPSTPDAGGTTDTSFSGYVPTPSGNYNATNPNVGQSVSPTPTADVTQFLGGTPVTSPMSGAGAPGSQVQANPNDFSYNSNDFSYNSPSSNLAGTAQPSAAPTASQSILDQLLGTKGAANFNPLGAVASTGALAYNLISGSPSASAEKQIKSIAAGQNQQGQQLENYLASGTLPPGAQQWINNQTAAQTAAIKAKYANLGMSGSTAETQELNNVQAQATAQMYQIASSLLQTGITETGASGQLYNVLMNAQNADSNAVSSAIQNFVTSLAGGGSAPGTVSLKLAG